MFAYHNARGSNAFAGRWRFVRVSAQCRPRRAPSGMRACAQLCARICVWLHARLCAWLCARLCTRLCASLCARLCARLCAPETSKLEMNEKRALSRRYVVGVRNLTTVRLEEFQHVCVLALSKEGVVVLPPTVQVRWPCQHKAFLLFML